MPYNPDIHHRRSIRLKGYDYTQKGAYFVTIVTHQRAHLFGKVVNGVMRLSEWGEIARREWFKTAELRPYVELYEDEFVVMPNHAHGIIWIKNDDAAGADVAGADAAGADVAGADVAGADVAGADVAGADVGEADVAGAERRSARTTLGVIVRAYKSAVTYAINAARQTRGMVVWQRNYYEHIIRNEADLDRIRKYIANNPLKWTEDSLR